MAKIWIKATEGRAFPLMPGFRTEKGLGILQGGDRAEVDGAHAMIIRGIADEDIVEDVGTLASRVAPIADALASEKTGTTPVIQSRDSISKGGK